MPFLTVFSFTPAWQSPVPGGGIVILTSQTRKLWWGWLGNLSKGTEPVSEEPTSDHWLESFIASSTSLQPRERWWGEF